MRPGMFEPLRTPAAFWQRADVLTALDQRDIGALFRLIRQHTGASQTRIGIAVGMPQSQVSVIMSTGPRRRHVISHDVFARIADGLKMPDQARVRLGLAPVVGTVNGQVRIDLVPSDHEATGGDGPWDEARGDDAVRRRDLFELAGATVVGAALGSSAPRTSQLQDRK